MMSKLPLEKMTTLQSIGFTWKWFYDTARGKRSKLSEEDRDLAVHYETLRELQMPYTSPRNIPFGRLPMLTHLELLSVQVLDDLGPTIRQVAQLESLSLFCTRGEHGRLFEALSLLKSELPNLHSLCLLSRRQGVLEGSHVQIIVDFLQGRTRLRRFRSTFTFRTEDRPRFLEAIASLRNLEALHWDVFTQDITRDFMRVFLQHIPSRMTALSLATAGTSKGGGALTNLVSPSCFRKTIHALTASKWDHCPDLRFFYFRTWGSEEEPIERLLLGAKCLRVVGYNGRFYYVEMADGKPHTSAAWSARRVAFRGLSDFGPECEDAEWLMRGLRIRNEAEEDLP